MSAAAPANPVHASVAFARVSQFEALSVSEQAARKQALESRVLAALADVPTAERIVLDAEEGLAVVLFGEAERALDVAQAIPGPGLPLQVGLNYGPLALTSRGADSRVFGDGLSEAVSAARFADAGQVLVTEAFGKTLEAHDPERATELASAGEFTDTRVRQHRFLAPDPQRRAARRRRLSIYAGGGAIIILLIGVLGRDIYQPMFQSRPAIVKLEVRPRGEVFVDGVSKGRVPPLTQLELPPGTRRIQIRQAGYRPYDATHDLKPGQRVTITHTLARQPEKKPEPDFWRDLKRKLF